ALNGLENHPGVLAMGPADFDLHIFGQTATTGLLRVGASNNAQNQTLVGKGFGVGIAVLDTGIDPQHPDLFPYISGKSFVQGVNSADDDNGHGTAVAGTIAARENGQGIVGVAPAAALYSVKVCDSTGACPVSNIVSGVNWVT